MTDTSPNWQEYVRRRKFYSLVLWGALPFGGFVAVNTFSDFTSHAVLAQSLAAIWFLLYIYAAVQLYRWPCPQCKKPFHSVFRDGSEFRVTCRHCDCQMPANLLKF